MWPSIVHTHYLHHALMTALHMFFTAWFILISIRILLLFPWKFSVDMQAQMEEVSSSLIYMSHTCTHRKLRGRCILFWIGIKLKFRHTLLEVVTLSKAGWGICLSLISTWRIWLFSNRTALANPRSDICACAAIIVSPALSWGKKSYILLVARGCFVVKSSVCCL
jgi:hypothetical protein